METVTKDIKSKLDQTNPDKREGKVATELEEQTAKIPTDIWLWVALGSMGVSLAFKLMRRNELANFIGLWAPSLLIMGTYNKLVKQLGHDSVSR